MPQQSSIETALSTAQVDAISQSFVTPTKYTIYFTQNAFSEENPILQQALNADNTDRVPFLCFIDSEVLKLHPLLPTFIRRYVESRPSIRMLAEPIPVQGGEACKNEPAELQAIYTALLNLSVDRHCCLLAIGGGAVLDLIGYAAATAHRGIRLIRMPTTVLSQNDSGVGVKNGINFLDRKNFLGTFAPPDAVISDFSFLSTLSERDKRAGLAEAIKVGLIRDSSFFDWLETNSAALTEFQMDAIAHSIKRSAQIHSNQIASGGDPFEKGSSRPLDYGHWLAHKLEAMSAYEVKHGEAVAIGMLVDARYSYESGLFPEQSLTRILRLLQALGFPLWHPALDIKNEQDELVVIEGLEEFREHLGGELSITLLQSIGAGIEVSAINPAILHSSLAWTRKQNIPP